MSQASQASSIRHEATENEKWSHNVNAHLHDRIGCLSAAVDQAALEIEKAKKDQAEAENETARMRESVDRVNQSLSEVNGANERITKENVRLQRDCEKKEDEKAAVIYKAAAEEKVKDAQINRLATSMLKIENEQKAVVANLIGQINQAEEEKTKATAKLARMEPEIREQLRSEIGEAGNRINIAETRAALAKSLEENVRRELEKVGRDAKQKLDAEVE